MTVSIAQRQVNEKKGTQFVLEVEQGWLSLNLYNKVKVGLVGEYTYPDGSVLEVNAEYVTVENRKRIGFYLTAK